MDIVAQREIGNGVQEIVSIDLHAGVTGVLQRPMTETVGKDKAGKPITQTWTFQAPKTLPDGRLLAYRCKPGEQFNLNPDRVECVIFDAPDKYRVLPRPETKAGLNVNPVRWEQHGHASPTDHGTLLHAALELEAWPWFLPVLPKRRQWCVVETDLTGRPTGYRVQDRAEPSWSPRGLTDIDPSGTGRIITPTRNFDKATSPIGSKSWGWFDPHLSPDGRHVVWLDVASFIPATSGLIVGDMETGAVRYLVRPTTSMQTDAMWIDNDRDLGSRYVDGHWRCEIIDLDGSTPAPIQNTQDCTALHVRL